jgi:hypothetical protein
MDAAEKKELEATFRQHIGKLAERFGHKVRCQPCGKAGGEEIEGRLSHVKAGNDKNRKIASNVPRAGT